MGLRYFCPLSYLFIADSASSARRSHETREHSLRAYQRPNERTAGPEPAKAARRHEQRGGLVGQPAAARDSPRQVHQRHGRGDGADQAQGRRGSPAAQHGAPHLQDVQPGLLLTDTQSHHSVARSGQNSCSEEGHVRFHSCHQRDFDGSCAR